jgi:hypothetical protein
MLYGGMVSTGVGAEAQGWKGGSRLNGMLRLAISCDARFHVWIKLVFWFRF